MLISLLLGVPRTLQNSQAVKLHKLKKVVVYHIMLQIINPEKLEKQ
jgi:hypothetical protein